MTVDIAALDAAGFMPRPGESEEDFISRVRWIIAQHNEFDERLKNDGPQMIFDVIKVSENEKIDPQIIAASGDVTWNLYRFRSTHVPGFFLSRSIGLLWGGCLIGDPDENFSVFLIRNSFRTRERWLFYRRTELFAHELCHSMRLDLHESTLEEYFAYQTSPSRLRRYLGNCFIRDVDAIFFVLPALLLFAATVARDFFLHSMPVWPFWILALIYPLFLLIRNANSRKVVARAGKKLSSFGITDIAPILFRCTRQELLELGALEDKNEFEKYCNDMTGRELRWKIICKRFINPEREGQYD